MAEYYGTHSKRRTYIRRFGIPIIAFVLIAAFLGHSLKNIIAPRLDGTFVKYSNSDILNHIATTEQIIREYFSNDEAMDLLRVENLSVDQNKVMLAHVIGTRQLTGEEIALWEGHIREVTKEDSLELILSTILRTLSNNEGLLSTEKMSRYFDSERMEN